MFAATSFKAPATLYRSGDGLTFGLPRCYVVVLHFYSWQPLLLSFFSLIACHLCVKDVPTTRTKQEKKLEKKLEKIDLEKVRIATVTAFQSSVVEISSFVSVNCKLHSEYVELTH